METTENIPETRRLTRPKDGRWFGGVAAGLGAYFDLSPAVYRIAFVALALAGGTGILLYLAAWAVIPEEGEEDSFAAAALKRQHDHPPRAIGLAVLAFAGILALSWAHWPSPGNLWLAAALVVAALVWQLSAQPSGKPAGALFPIAVGGLFAVVGLIAVFDLTGVWNVDWRIVLGAMVVVTGSLVVAGATTGRAVGAVVVLGVALLAALAVALAVRVPLFAGVGDRVAHPESIAALDSKYELGIGDFEVDLSDVPLPVGRTHVKTTLGIGDLTVRVPRDARVVVDTHASAGEVSVFGESIDGTSVDFATTAPGADPGRVLVLDARVGLGQVEVLRG
jgi:phage shock protein PspC (stress-responsive transcriptional regulator)